jgi:hypothetical protein
MLIYCYEPLGLPFDAALPAFLRAVDDEQVHRTLFRGEPDRPAILPGEIGGHLNLGELNLGPPTEEDGRVAVPIQCSTEDPSLIAMVGEITLSRLGPALCHLSLNSSLTGRLAAGFMYNRNFQMAAELAVAEFLGKLARAVEVLAPSGHGRGPGSCSA